MTDSDRLANRDNYRFENKGFSVFSGPPDVQERHRHNEIEMAVFAHAPIVALYGGRKVHVPPNRMVVFWGAMPHNALKVEKQTIGYGVRIPLSTVLRWDLPGEFTKRLIDLEVFLVPQRTIPCSDLALVRNWVEMMKKHGALAADIVLLEVESRLRRLALETGGIQSPGAAIAPGNLDRFERIVGMIARQYGEKLGVAEIACTVGLHRNHVMRIFRQMTGMSILEYIMRHRVCHAQRLLATTDMKIIDVGHEAGFNSPTRFYATFRNATGQSPGKYRRNVLSPRLPRSP